MPKSMSGNSRLILLLAREPLKNSNADLSNAKDTLALIIVMISIFIKILVYDSKMGEDFVNRFFWE